MWVLVLTDPEGRVREISFEGESLSFGRSASADVTVDDPRSSRMHLRFNRTGRNLTVTDLGAANGVYVQGQRIQGEATLAVGDQLQFGGCRVRVATPVSTYAPGMSQTSMPVLGASGEPLEVQSWKLQIKEYGISLRLDRAAVLGRSISADIVVDHPSVSRRHLSFTPTPDGLRLDDVGGTNGSYVHGRLIAGSSIVNSPCEVVCGEVAIVLKPIRGRLGHVLERFDAIPKTSLLRHGAAALLAVTGFILLLASPSVTAESSYSRRQAELEGHLTKANELVRSKAWSDALPSVDRVLQVDPLNKEADALRALIGRETSAQTQFEGAIEARDTGDYDKAVNAFDAVAPGTRYYNQAQSERVKAQGRLLAQYRDRAEQACRESKWKVCQQEACNHLAYEYNRQMVRVLAQAEAALKRRGRSFNRCPAERKEPEDLSGDRRRLREALALRHPDARMLQAAEQYAMGDLSEAKSRLKTVLTDERRRSLQGAAASLRRQIQKVDQHLKAIKDVDRKKDLAAALQEWQRLSVIDHEIVGKRVESKVRRDARGVVAGFLNRRATTFSDQGRWADALEDLVLIIGLEPGNLAARQSLTKLISKTDNPKVKKLAQQALQGKSGVKDSKASDASQ
ncbi:MAG: FHA domain-containing protein [Myxococcota bacterium]|nr:hypothetical protein [Myxococcales bacterium]MEC7751772.1 FHA domain-containing protein [Myxococcota bacterium]